MKKLEQEMANLRRMLGDMGDQTNSMVALATGAITSNDHTVTEDIDRREDQLDQAQLEVDREAIRILTIYGPVACDLRFVLSVSRVATSLERIGDQAVNICEDLRLLVDNHDRPMEPMLRTMAKLVAVMVHDAIASFLFRDVKKATTTLADDDRVDSMNDRIVKELLHEDAVREAISGPGRMAGALSQILISRSLERMADQATNVCEEVVYMVKGDDIRHGTHGQEPPQSTTG